MKQFKLLNNVVGWLVFMLTGKFFSLFASGPEQVAYWINVMSALLSAFCILFLFWSITHLTRKLLCTDGVVETLGQTLTILASGVAGALAYTWSDTFWFSAVEGEVYAYSSMFTALVFWLILKWEDNADSPHADRWIVLIFYLTGLSIGVHLLNLLCLPAIVLVYYYKKTPDANLKGSLMALGLSVVLVAAVLYGVVPGIVKVGGWFELFFVNVLGLPFNSGMIIYILVLIGVVSAALWSTLQSNRVRTVALYLASVGMLGIPFYGKGYVTPLLLGAVVLCALWFLLQWKKNGQYVVRKRALNTSLLCMLMLMIGYSSYALIVLPEPRAVRSEAPSLWSSLHLASCGLRQGRKCATSREEKCQRARQVRHRRGERPARLPLCAENALPPHVLPPPCRSLPAMVGRRRHQTRGSSRTI